MKRFLLFVTLFIIIVSLISCGGGSGSSSSPPGVSPGMPSVVQLLPTSYIAQTNGCILLGARVLDGNGNPVSNIPVNFTNLSGFGKIIDKCSGSEPEITQATTGGDGYAKVYLYSTTPGFATVLAQVYTGVGQVRDRKSVYFTIENVLEVSMSLDVESVPANETPVVYNDIHDINLFESATDDTAEVLATVYDAGRWPVDAGMSVTWSSSHTEAKFIFKETQTDENGQAKAVVQVTPSSIRNTETHVNIMASAFNDAANMVTLFLRPVIVAGPPISFLTANPTIVNTGGTSTITAVVFLNTGAPAPDGTTVNFTTNTNCGTVTPFAQTTGGVATATFTAPVTPGTCTVTATAGGVTIGSVTITVTATLTVTPASATITTGAVCAIPVGNTATYTISGGVAPYTVSTSNPSNTSFTVPTAGNSTTVAASGGIFTIAYDVLVAADTTVTITVVDSVGTTKTVDFKIDCP